LRKPILLTCLLFVLCYHLDAQIITDRPDQTESSSTVGNGNLQIESGLLVEFDGSSRHILLPTNLFRYGVSEMFELRILSQYERYDSDEFKTFKGISDLEIGAKIQLLKGAEKNIEIAFLSHLIVPSGTKSISGDEYATINKLSISHELGDNMGLGYNIGYDYFNKGSGDLTYSLALGIAVNEKVGVYIEPYGALINIEDFEANFNAGITYLQNENLQFDFSFGTGLTDKMNFLSLGASWLILRNND